jgi:ferritin-like metal-binding protein YciE
MSAAERELKECEQDTIIENAEVTGYNMLIQWAIKLNISVAAAGADAIPLLRQNLAEEEKMFAWLRASAPIMFAKLWPQIENG